MARPQHMGFGLSSCLNQTGWRHLFRPNSDSAIAGQNACIDYWMRTSGGGGSIPIAQVAKSMIAPPRPRYPQADSQGTERLMVQVAMLAALAVIGYFIYKA